MKVRTQFAALVLTSLAFGVALPAGAAEKGQKGPNKGKPTAAAASSAAAGVETLRTAQALARYGDANKDPLALIVAARLIQNVGAKESQAVLTRSKPAEGQPQPDSMAVTALVERAKAAAGGRADLVALADDVSKSGMRGAVGGPGSRTTVVARNGVDSYRVTFRAGEPARVAVSGDGDSDLDLYVYDEFGNTICRDDDSSDDMYCAWNPRWQGTFTIRVRNLGMANQYRIVHN